MISSANELTAPPFEQPAPPFEHAAPPEECAVWPESRLRVLLIDDNDVDRKIMAQCLAEHSGVRHVRTATNGLRALEYLMLDGYEPDFVILDLRMPVLDGHELLKQLDHLFEARPIPILVASSSSRQEDIQFTWENHACSYFVKPGSLARTRSTLHHAVNLLLAGKLLPRLL